MTVTISSSAARETESTPSALDAHRGRRCVLVAAGARPAGDSFVRRHDLHPALVLTKADLMVGPLELRRRVAEAGAELVIVHSGDWRRQPNPQLYELALLFLPARDRVIVDDVQGIVRRMSGARLVGCAARTLPDGISAGAAVTAEALRITRATWRRPTRPKIDGRSGARRLSGSRKSDSSVMAIWPASGQGYGGSISHLTGILNGFRRAGLRIGLVTTAPPTAEVQAVADEVEVIAPLPPGARVTGDCMQICANRPLHNAAMRMASRLQPSFVYQRHSPFLVTGAEIGAERRIPFVLEWNGSEVWVRQNWHDTLPIERCLDRLVEQAERAVVTDAELITAVSEEAANMAARAGAARPKVLVLPNAVDLEYVDRCLNGAPDRVEKPRPAASGHEALLGWAGTFGGWHGATVIIRALPQLRPNVRLVMVGDGNERPACESLARELCVADRIEWAGSVPRPEALRRLARCDLLVSPHVPLEGGEPFFGSPTKLFEYMALGKPIVASRLAQIGEILEDGVTARLVTPGNVTELADGISDVLDSPDRGGRLGRAARLEAESCHTWDHRARTVLDRLADLPGMQISTVRGPE